ncbi:MAG TPA: hypothetical protein VMT45_02710 [Thermoanaerobaculaceae bacterium]|nr:hypothetical protein [Thermoanaerobaculaceae bacterium]
MNRMMTLLALLAASAVWAAARAGQTVVVGTEESVPEDLYVVGSDVTVLGTVNGDLVVAGGNVRVEGPVTGSILAAGGRVELIGPVGGSVRAVGGEVVLRAAVPRDAVLAGGKLSIARGAAVGRDLLAAGGAVDVAAPVGREARLAGQDVVLGGPVSGDVMIEAGTLRLASGARLGGRLAYGSDKALVRDEGASVAGPIEHHEPRITASTRPLPLALRWARAVLGFLALGLLWRALAPGTLERTEEALVRDPWSSLATGLAVLFGGLLGAALVFAIGMLVGGWWISGFVLSALALGCALAFPLVGDLLGGWILRRLGKASAAPAWRFAVGLMLLVLVLLIPLLGGLVGLAVVLFGLGVEFNTLRRHRPQAHASRPLVQAAAGS